MADAVYTASEQILNDLNIPIPWTLAGQASEAKVNRNKPLNVCKPPRTLAWETFITTLLLPIVLTVLFIRTILGLNVANYFSTYEQSRQRIKTA